MPRTTTKKSAARLDREIGQMLTRDRLFVATYPTGISYADRARERGGDYVRLAFLPFHTLTLEWSRVSMPDELRQMILVDARRLQDRRGESYPISSAGQTVRLGG